MSSAPDRRMPAVAAICLFLLIVSVGVVVAKTATSRGTDKVAMTPPVTSPSATGAHFDTPTTSPSSGTQTQNAGQAPSNAGQPQTNSAQAPANTPNRQHEANSDHGQRDDSTELRDGGSVLPNPNVPIILKPDGLTGSITNTISTPPKKTGTTSNQPPVVEANDPPPVNREQDLGASKNPPGVMEIQIVGKGSKPGDSSDPSNSHNGIQALLRTAQNEFQVGHYGVAATSYERALRAGASPASGNQRLAQCYERLGRNSEAVAAYHRAIDSLQSELDSGRGDKDRISTALDSCKQAVKVLGG